ncbi:hypothetical protein [Mycolicibacterium lutetiense]
MAALIGSGCLAVAAQAGADPATQEQATKYSECMRANGVADFPNPNAEGQFPDGGVSVDKATWQNAVGACANLQPPGWSADAQRTAAQQDAALGFAQCVRDHGVPDFPDPATARDPLIDTSKMRGDVSASSIPELKPAVAACNSYFTAALPPVGTGRPG